MAGPEHQETREEPLFRWFDDYEAELDHHDLRVSVGKWFRDLALTIIFNLPRSAERTVALRKALESRDAAFRAVPADQRILPERKDT